MDLRCRSTSTGPFLRCARKSALVASVALLLGCSGVNCGNIIRPPTVPDAVSAVLHAPHGLSYQSGTNAVLLDLLRAQPEAAAREVARKITLKQVAGAVVTADRETILSFERGIELLNYLGSTESDQVLTSWYIGLQALRATEDRQFSQEFEVLGYQILNNLNTRYAQPVVDSIIERWNEMTTNERLLSLVYVTRASPGRVDVADKLRSMSRDGAPDRNLLERAANYIEGH